MRESNPPLSMHTSQNQSTLRHVFQQYPIYSYDAHTSSNTTNNPHFDMPACSVPSADCINFAGVVVPNQMFTFHHLQNPLSERSLRPTESGRYSVPSIGNTATFPNPVLWHTLTERSQQPTESGNYPITNDRNIATFSNPALWHISNRQNNPQDNYELSPNFFGAIGSEIKDLLGKRDHQYIKRI
ncbi:hypothetical protein GJ496_007080 [Pomphorhynchus laevis]|nr:hypothetical protein GJ496_007080 [Pomphorhynchus laevis]